MTIHSVKHARIPKFLYKDFPYKTQSSLLPLYGKIRIKENSRFDIIYAVIAVYLTVINDTLFMSIASDN